MEISTKLDILDQMYEIYETFSTGLSVACMRGCASCCTQNVTMTTLEGYRILEHWTLTGQTDYFQRFHRAAHNERFRPTLSTNELAAICLQGEDPTEDESTWPQGVCPFLSDKECLIYLHRPFGCRCFFSTQECEKTAYATLDPFIVTVNSVFLQFIEHVDADGLFGNMTDVLLLLESEPQRKRYEAGGLDDAMGLPVNRCMPGLFVPPEDRLKIQPILQKIKNVCRFSSLKNQP